MTYLLWDGDFDNLAGYCPIQVPYIKNGGKLHLGVPTSDIPDFPKDITFRMSAIFPENTRLCDAYKCSGHVVISQRVKEFLAPKLKGHSVEYIPVSILDHAKAVASKDYFVLHSQDVVDCIDIKKSKVSWNPLNKQMVTSCKGLVINSQEIPAKLLLFRPKHWGTLMFISNPLAEALKAERFTGLWFRDPQGYTGI